MLRRINPHASISPLIAPPLRSASPGCREKDAEVSSLKQAVAERDVKLKSAKGELLEARMSLQQKDSELKVGAGCFNGCHPLTCCAPFVAKQKDSELKVGGML